MSKLIWFIFLFSFASVFEESQQLNGVISSMDAYDPNDSSMRSMTEEQLEYCFTQKYVTQRDCLWTDLRLNMINKLKNLCVLTWNDASVDPVRPQRYCIAHRNLREIDPISVLVYETYYIVDTLTCYCSTSEFVSLEKPFVIAPYTNTEYFKLKLENVPGRNARYTIKDLMTGVPKYANISQEERYYDHNVL